MERIRRIRTFSRREDWTEAVLYQIERQGDTLMLDGGKFPIGMICFPVIDGGESGFQWSRAWLEGSFPAETALRVRCYVSDTPEDHEGGFDRRVRELLTEDDPLAAAQRLFGEPIAEGSDFLIGQSGRYLRLMLELGSADGKSPFVSALRVQFTADHMTDYLPAIYRGDDFTYRFMSIFDSMVSDLEQRIDTISEELDIRNANDGMLSYLASWLCLEPTAERGALQQRMQTALQDYETMYTVEGVRRTIRRLTGYDAEIIEGKDVDPNALDTGDSDMLRELYGDNPYRFFALISEDAFPTAQAREQMLAQMRRYIPAGIEMELIPLHRGVQLGWHSYLGINTELQGFASAVIDDNSSIHFDTMIGGDK